METIEQRLYRIENAPIVEVVTSANIVVSVRAASSVPIDQALIKYSVEYLKALESRQKYVGY